MAKAAAPQTPINVSTLGMKISGVTVNPATGGEPPLVPPPPPPPPLPEEDSVINREIASCLAALDARLATDAILRADMAAFEGAEWHLVARGVIRAEAGGRWAKVNLGGDQPMVELGSLAWEGSKRIPL